MERVREKEKKAFEKLKEVFSYKNKMQSPKIEKIVVSVGVGKIRAEKEKMQIIEDRLAKITGQKPAVVPAKKSVATFKVREGDTSGYKVTLRGPNMYAFLDKFLVASLPRTKDFRGINTSAVDEMGNLTIGIPEHIIFPETTDEELRNVFGLSVCIVSSAKNKKEAHEFFKFIGIPFKKEKKD